MLVVATLIVMRVPSIYNVLGTRIVEMISILQGYRVPGGDVSRLLLFSYGIDWFQDSPLLGIGINNYRVLSNITYPFVGRNFYAHSNLVELLVDVGIIGTLIYYSAFFYMIKEAMKKKIVFSKIVIVLATTFLLHDILSMSYYDLGMQVFICIGFILLRLPVPMNERKYLLQ